MVGKILAANTALVGNGVNSLGKGFKAVLERKRMGLDATNKAMNQPKDSAVFELKRIISDMVKDHEIASRSIRTSMTKGDYSPERLLDTQYRTGLLFLREQLFCRTVELSANTFKNFTQMQV